MPTISFNIEDDASLEEIANLLRGAQKVENQLYACLWMGLASGRFVSAKDAAKRLGTTVEEVEARAALKPSHAMYLAGFTFDRFPVLFDRNALPNE